MYAWDRLLCCFLFCFPIQQFNEKLKDQTGNPWQQPRDPRFVMLSMLHCKQIQTAYHRQQTLKRSIKLCKVIALENTHRSGFSPLKQTDCPFLSNWNEQRSSFCLVWEDKFDERGVLTQVIFFPPHFIDRVKLNISFGQSASIILVLSLLSRSYRRSSGLDLAENNSSLLPWPLGELCLQRKTLLHPKCAVQIIFRGGVITGLVWFVLLMFTSARETWASPCFSLHVKVGECMCPAREAQCVC